MSGGLEIRVWCAASTAAREVDASTAPRKSEEEGAIIAVKKEEVVDAITAIKKDEEEADAILAAKETEEEDGKDRGSPKEAEQDEETLISCISEAQLSPDGTCIFTTDYARKFSVYPFAPNVSVEEGQQKLTPYAQLASSDPIWAFAVNPFFNLNDRNTTNFLASRRDQYIGLHNALWDISINPDIENQKPSREGPVDISSKIASYKLVDKLTEAVTAPISLAWSPDGAYFYAGQKHTIAVFDFTYTDDPITTIRTIPSTRNKLKGGGWGFKGDVSALAPCPPTSTTTANVLAAGTRTRHVGLYDVLSSKETTHFALPGTSGGVRTDNPNFQDVIGSGVTQLKWSPDGNYLYVAERMSDALLIYDVRNYKLALGHCVGRRALLSRQKMGFDIWAQSGEYSTAESHEVWAGGTDGMVRIWRNPCLSEGAVEADEVIDVGEGPVSSVLVHPYGHAAVVARGRYEVGGDREGKGVWRGGVTEPAYREWGCLDILGLGSY